MYQVITNVKKHVNLKVCECTAVCRYLSVTCSAKTALSGLYMKRIHYKTTQKQFFLLLHRACCCDFFYFNSCTLLYTL